MNIIQIIAKNRLEEFFDRIQFVGDELCDFLVSTKSTGLFLSIRVFSSTINDNDIVQYRNAVVNALRGNTIPHYIRHSILIMTINKDSGETSFHRFMQLKYDNAQFVKIDLSGMLYWDADNINNVLSVMDSMITPIPNKYWSVQKSISLNDNNYSDMEIIYFRKFTSNYKMSSPEKLTSKQHFDRCLNRIPEEEYPTDLLDNMILEAIMFSYPNARVLSSLLVFNTELKKLQEKKALEIISGSITFIPKENVDSIANAVMPNGCLPQIPINVIYPKPTRTVPRIISTFGADIDIADWDSLIGKLDSYKPLKSFLL